MVGAAAYNTGWLDQYLADGAAPWIDVVAFHIYDYDAVPESDLPTLADVRTVMADNRILADPLWITEGAVGDTGTAAAAAPGLIAGKYLVDLLHRARLLDWYAWGPASGLTATWVAPHAFTPHSVSDLGGGRRSLTGGAPVTADGQPVLVTSA